MNTGNGKIEREAISAMRRTYGEVGLDQIPTDPFDLFHAWLKDAAENPFIVEANAMVVSTVDGVQPSSRTVLLKDVTDKFSFFTNYNSRKAREIAGNSHISLLFPWYAMERQVSVIGVAKKVSAEESDAYFASRPRESQLGAWASSQSEKLISRSALEEKFAEFSQKFPNEVPRPPHWGGYLVTPITFEFWQGRYSRLHDRFIYTKNNSDWELVRLNP